MIMRHHASFEDSFKHNYNDLLSWKREENRKVFPCEFSFFFPSNRNEMTTEENKNEGGELKEITFYANNLLAFSRCFVCT